MGKALPAKRAGLTPDKTEKEHRFLEKLSPMMQQYAEIKKQHQGYILFYRLGDFYEMFFDDALLASRELELTLTGRDCGLPERAPMCGVPYHACDTYVKKLVAEGKAFPCFCEKSEGIEEIKQQREKKFATGYVSEHDACRNLSMEQIEQNLKAGKKFAIRLKSNGNPKEKVEFYDILKGTIKMEQNSKDVVILKSDFLPPYHFAHAVDDTLMGTTVVVRGEEWLPSTPAHIEIFEALGFEKMTYLHNPLICIKDGEKKRKVSKRKDKELAMSFYAQEGYPTDAVCEYVMNLVNSGFEIWRNKNPMLPYTEYHFEPLNVTANSPVLDMNKMNDISKDVISKYTAQQCFEYLLWQRTFRLKMWNILKEKENMSPRC